MLIHKIQGDPTSPSQRRSVLGVHWKDWCWSWNSNTLATSWEELTHWKRPWYWEGLGAGGEGDDRGWDGWMASPTQWAWVWVNSGSWWWTGSPGVLWFMGSQRVGHDWATELNWTEWNLTQESWWKKNQTLMHAHTHVGIYKSKGPECPTQWKKSNPHRHIFMTFKSWGWREIFGILRAEFQTLRKNYFQPRILYLSKLRLKCGIK